MPKDLDIESSSDSDKGVILYKAVLEFPEIGSVLLEVFVALLSQPKQPASIFCLNVLHQSHGTEQFAPAGVQTR